MASNVINDVVATESKLNDKQKEFCRNYIVNMNGLQSYRNAYGEQLSDNTCKSNASQLLSSTNIKGYINDLIDNCTDKFNINVIEIVTNLKSIMTDPTARNADRIKASEILGRHLNMFVERKEITTIGTSITVTLLEEDVDAQLLSLGYDPNKLI